MQTETLLLIILAGIIALLIAIFQYYKKSMSKLNMLFLFIRFISVFAVLLLVINPRFEKTKLTIEKPNLVVAVDNSSSVKYLNQQNKVEDFVSNLQNNSKLNNAFHLEFYSFGTTLNTLDSLSFNERQTNIFNAFTQLNQIYKQSTAPTLLITDGNQTFGKDYQFVTNSYNQPIYPIVLGDTITHTDLRIEQLNVNKYAYLKNNFPVEVVLVYNGRENLNSKFVVTQGSTTIFSQSVNFSNSINSKVLNFALPANRVGVSQYKAELIPFENEKNTVNNAKNFAVEVINEKTKIAIVSDFIHPDLGVFKKSIESNEQRSAVFLNSKEIINQINDFQLIILYQPNYSFKELYSVLKNQNRNKLIVVGTKTNLNFLNSENNYYDIEITNQIENYQAELNRNYAPFLIDDIDFESFPPLESNFGSVIFSVPFETILTKTINGIATNEPLLATFEIDNRREAVLFGENIWQWRAQNYVNTKSFHEFDNFIGKLIQYLASNKSKSRLNIDYESFYNGSSEIIIKAEYFDKNYVFDTRESLNITVTDKVSNEQKTFPLILKNNNYQVDLSSLQPSEYSFVIKATNENISKSGNFQVLEYEVEQQFLSADVTKLWQLATNSEGVLSHIDNTGILIESLVNNERYKPIQKSTKNIIPLIDWKYLLALITLSLSAEWFLRKYNGLI